MRTCGEHAVVELADRVGLGPRHLVAEVAVEDVALAVRQQPRVRNVHLGKQQKQKLLHQFGCRKIVGLSAELEILEQI